MKRPRLRKWGKWACTLAAVLVVGLAGFSGFYAITFSSYNSWTHNYTRVAQGGGTLWVFHGDYRTPSRAFAGEGWAIQRLARWNWDFGLMRPTTRTPMPRRWGLDWKPHDGGGEVGICLLYIALLPGIPAAILWYADRRCFGPGLCKKCGYDRRGLAADAKCPECGAAPTT